MVVYLEEAIIENFCIDFSLLYCSLKLTRHKIAKFRLVLSALFGAVYAVGMSMAQLPVALQKIIDFLFGIILCLVANKNTAFKNNIIFILVFYAVTFLYGGALTFLCNYCDIPLTEGHGYVVENLPVGGVLAVVFFFTFFLVSYSAKLCRRKLEMPFTYRCALLFADGERELTGFLDTGNRLYDGVSPVAIVALSTLAKMTDIRKIDFRKIPVHTVNGSSEMSVFSLDALVIYCKDKPNIIKNVTVGVTDRTVSDREIILHPAFWEEIYDRNTQTHSKTMAENLRRYQ